MVAGVRRPEMTAREEATTVVILRLRIGYDSNGEGQSRSERGVYGAKERDREIRLKRGG